MSDREEVSEGRSYSLRSVRAREVCSSSETSPEAKNPKDIISQAAHKRLKALSPVRKSLGKSLNTLSKLITSTTEDLAAQKEGAEEMKREMKRQSEEMKCEMERQSEEIERLSSTANRLEAGIEARLQERWTGIVKP